jgi:hypothetical protein
MNLTIIDIAFHRNGICGAPLHVVLFQDDGPEGSRKVGIIFQQEGHCAVLDVAKLAQGDITFGVNSFRGDHYEPHLRKAIVNRQRAIDAETSAPPSTETNQTVTTNDDIDIDAILADRKQIALIWSIDDVQDVRPDLTDDQAWEVLRQVKSDHDATIGVTFETLEWVAQDLFGDAPETDDAGGVHE